jgi:prolyl oligopeptidase
MVLKMETSACTSLVIAVFCLGAALIPAQTSSKASTGTVKGGDRITLPLAPETEKIPVVDDYFGTKITDDYRWLEDAKSTETRAYLDQQIAYTDRYLKQAKVRPELSENLDALIYVTTWSTPIQRGNSYFFLKRLSAEDQPSIYVRHGWAADAKAKSPSKAGATKQAANELGKDIRLVDPASLSRDPNTSVSLNAVSEDGSLLVYGVRQGGADEEELHIFNVKTRKALDD